MKRLLAYLQLLRLPNVFTAMADVFAGFLISHGSLQPWVEFVPLVLGSSCLYLAGMVLNDWFDVEVDRLERPERPLPSGRIPRSHALVLGIGLLVVGVAAACAVGGTSRNVALLLAACVLLYDGLLKDTLIGPALMGLCRALNVLLGMSSVPGSIWLFDQDRPPTARFGTMVAAGVGLYIMSVTRLARSEADLKPQAQPVSSTLGINLGLLLVAFAAHVLHRWGPLTVSSTDPYWARGAFDSASPGFGPAYSETVRFYMAAGIWGAVVLITNAMVWRALSDAQPAKVQQAVKTCIVALIGLDAAIVALVNGPVWACGLLLLLVPTLTVGRWVYST